MSLDRFINAQRKSYANALQEIQKGKKLTHWMWYIFPQLQGLGHSETAKFYAIKDLAEAKAYLAHPILGKRLMEVTEALIALQQNDALKILGSPDYLKLKSSMTLFAHLPNANPIFQAVLGQYFGGQLDQATLKLLEAQ